MSIGDWDERHPLLTRTPADPNRPLYEKTTENQIYHYCTTTAPVVRYVGTAFSRFRIFRSEYGITYDGPARAFEVGMTVREVSEILRLDFSEGSGLHFRFYGLDTFLHVAFENGRVSDISTGWNGLDIELRP